MEPATGAAVAPQLAAARATGDRRVVWPPDGARGCSSSARPTAAPVQNILSLGAACPQHRARRAASAGTRALGRTQQQPFGRQPSLLGGAAAAARRQRR